MARLDAHDWQASLCQPVEEPLRELARLQPDPLQLPGWILQDPQKILRMAGDLDLSADCLSTQWSTTPCFQRHLISGCTLSLFTDEAAQDWQTATTAA